MAIIFVQEWTGSPDTAANATSKTATGAATTAGNTLLLRLMVRVEDIQEAYDVAIADDGGNTWELVASLGTAPEDSDQVYLYRANNANAVTSVTASWTRAGGSYSNVAMMRLVEFSGVGDVVDVGSSLATGGVPNPPGPIAATAAGQLVFGVAGVRSTTGTWTSSGLDVTPTDLDTYRGQQVSLYGAYALTADADDVGISWGGHTPTIFMLNAVFEESSGSPDPIAVSVGSDQSVYVGQAAAVTAVATGGASALQYAWTRVSGPTGSFLNANQASTTFNPTGGAGTYVLRCVVTDGVSTPAQDDLILTVSAAPDYVTFGVGVTAPSWAVVGGTLYDVLRDTSNSTLATSPDDPVEAAIEGPVLMGVDRPAGAPFRAHFDVRAIEATTSSWVAELWNAGKTTMYSTTSGSSLGASFQTVSATFPAADLETITTAQWTTSGLWVVLKFSAAG